MDLRSIVKNSREAWGDQQAMAYRQRLEDAFARIVRYPEIGMAFPQAVANVRRLTVAQHHIYYVRREQGIYIARVINVRMDEPDLEL